jgi:hypothetical protein
VLVGASSNNVELAIPEDLEITAYPFRRELLTESKLPPTTTFSPTNDNVLVLVCHEYVLAIPCTFGFHPDSPPVDKLNAASLFLVVTTPVPIPVKLPPK